MTKRRWIKTLETETICTSTVAQIRHIWYNRKMWSHLRQTLILQVRNHNQCLFYFILPFLNIQISSRSLHLDFLTEQRALSHSSAEHQAQHHCPHSLPECVCGLTSQTLVVSLWPKEYVVRRGSERGSQTVLWGWCASMRKQDLVGEAVDVQREHGPGVRLSCKAGLATVPPITSHGYFWPA